MATALYAGSFDPITFGHLSVVERVMAIFDKVIIGVGHNPEKTPFLDVDTRVRFIQEWLDEEERCDGRFVPDPDWITVESYSGLTTDFAKEREASILIRGVREESDLKSELYIARINRRLAGIETLFFGPDDKHMLVSSTFVRQVWELGQDPDRLVGLVPQLVIDDLVARRSSRKHQLAKLTIKARGGDDQAAKDLVALLAEDVKDDPLRKGN